MAQLLGGNQVKLNDGRVVTAQEGGWYDGRRLMGGSLLKPGEHQPGQLVDPKVNIQSDIAQGNQPGDIEKFLASQRQQLGVTATPSTRPVPSTGPSGPGFDASSLASTTPATLNLPDLYSKLFTESGVTDLQSKLSEQEKALTEAKGEINDNPFLSEATRVGRVAKLEQLFNERTANLRSDIATKQADIETKLNLQLKQFDINSEATKLAWDQFNTLLTAGALDDASGESIAQITRSTGISSDMILSAIKANKRKNVNSQVIQSTADSGEVTISVIDKDTGEIINQSSLGMIGNRQTGSKQSESEQKQLIREDLISEVRGGVTLQDAFRLASGFLDANDVLNLYNVNSIYGPAIMSDKKTKDLQPWEWNEEKLTRIGVKF